MQGAPDVEAAIAALVGVRPRFDTLPDDELLALGRSIEQLGRLVDARRIAFAAEVEHRSRKTLGEDSLAFRNGAKDGVELVQQTARIDQPAAKRRVGLGAAVAPVVGFDGSRLPGRHPLVREALEAGAVGVESARLVVNTVKAVRRRAQPEQVEAMVCSLLDTAALHDTEVLHDVADAWVLALDPDGAEPREAIQRHERALRLSRTLLNGTTRMTVVLTPEHLAMLRELLQSRRRGGGLIRTDAGSDATGDDLGPEWREDDRSRAQQDYDTLMEAIDAGVRAEHAGTTATAAAVTHEVVVQVSAAEVEARHGQGWAPGITAGLPMPVIERRACSGGVRLLVTGERGEPLFLSRRQRLFTDAQKKALVLAAAGRCQFPGCRTPAPYLEAHHVEWWHRDTGPISIDNGVMLCSHHHHLVHAKRSPVEIRRHGGVPHLVPTGWTGPPDAQQCMRGASGPRPPSRVAAPDDPWRRSA